jgi:hypothetical protein
MPHPDDYEDYRGDEHPDDRPRDRRPSDPYDRRGDEGYDDYEEPGRGPRGRVARARQKVSLPALFMLITGLLCLAFNVMAIALLWLAPDTIVRGKYDLMKDLFPQQPLPPYEEFLKQEQTQQTGLYALRIVASLLVVVGAMKMRSLQGYGLAMTAAVVSVIPACVNECCCMLPFGIWALIVLLNGEVKQGFSIMARGESLG